MIPVLLAYIIVMMLYCGLMLWLLPGLKDISEETCSGSARLEVSVIVPFRNAAGSLPGLIQDLHLQDYPLEKYSVILVNDHSSDGSADLARVRISGLPNFTLLELPEPFYGKKKALAHAITHCRTEWILQTDADCRVGPGFIRSHVALAGKSSPGLVAGWVAVGKGAGGFLSSFERLETLSLVGTGAASFRRGRPLMCSGANIMYSRSLYESTRAYDPSEKVESGDDMFLMIGARRLDEKLVFNFDRASMVSTAPAGSLNKMIRQRIRWGAKSRYYRKGDIQAVALLVLMTNLLLILSPLCLLISRVFLVILPLLFVIKGLIDYHLLYRSAKLTGQRRLMRAFLPAAILYYPFMFLIVLGLIPGKSNWQNPVR